MKPRKEKETPRNNHEERQRPVRSTPIVDEPMSSQAQHQLDNQDALQAAREGQTSSAESKRMQEEEATGEEALGGHSPTPDQDIVDELGESAGIEFQDDQPLKTHEEVWEERDRRRWELDRRSADDASE